jgi:hypothetical protein
LKLIVAILASRAQYLEHLLPSGNGAGNHQNQRRVALRVRSLQELHRSGNIFKSKKKKKKRERERERDHK